MKRLIILCNVLVLSHLLEAQGVSTLAVDTSTFSVGLKAEMTLTSLNASKDAPVRDNPGVGASFGPFVNFHVSKSFAVEMDMLLQFKHSIVSFNSSDFDYKQLSLDVPLYFLYQQFLNRGDRIYVGGGPYGEFGYISQLTGNGYKIDLYKKDEVTEISSMIDFCAGFGAILGYEFPFHLQVYATGRLSITNMVYDNRKPFGLYPYLFSVGAAYRIVSK